MSVFEVLEVSISPQAREVLLDLSIDRPAPGDRGDTFTLPLEGWVLGREGQPQRVEVVYRDRVIQSAALQWQPERVARTRPELRERHPELPPDVRCGFLAAVGLLGLTPEFELELRSRFDDGRTVPTATIRARHEPLRTPREPTLQPLLVTAPARSGTTWLMKVLARHPSVVVFDRYPYESWPAKFWTHALKVLTDPADFANSSRVHGFDGDPFLIGHNPFFRFPAAQQPELEAWLGRTHIERMAAFFLDTIEDWYLTVARIQGVERPRYFAEKQMTRLAFSPVLMRELYPRAKEVFLVRDFRDLACSLISTQTDPETGETRAQLAGKTREEYLRNDGRVVAQDFRDAWRERGDRAHLVRYEELVLHPSRAVSELLAYLELERGPETVSAMLEAKTMSAHMTSPDAERSIGRWRREDQQFQALCEEVLRDVLDEFGYEP